MSAAPPAPAAAAAAPAVKRAARGSGGGGAQKRRKLAAPSAGSAAAATPAPRSGRGLQSRDPFKALLEKYGVGVAQSRKAKRPAESTAQPAAGSSAAAAAAAAAALASVDVSTLEPRPDASAFLSEPVGAAEGAGFPLALLRGEVDCFFRAQHLGLDAMPLEYDFPTRSALPGDGWLARLRAAELRQQLQLLGMERQRLATQGKLLALHSRRLLTEGDRSNRFEETVRIDPTVPDLFPPCNFAEAPCRKPAMPHSLFCFGHLWADPEQMLFVRCAFRGEGDQQCQRGALAAAGRVNVCDLHAAYAPAPPAPAAAAALAPAPVTAAAAAAAAAAASSAS